MSIPFVPQGLYQCVASNKVGQSSTVSELAIKLPPFPVLPPPNVTGTILAPTRANITWGKVTVPLTSSDQLGYLVFLNRRGEY